MKLSGENVLLQAHAQYRGPLTSLAQRLKADGANVHLYVTNADQIEHYQSGANAGLFASIVDTNVLYPACRENPPPMADVIADSRAVENDLGITINELAISDRHLGRGFALGGYRHPRSRMSETVDYRSMLHGFNRTHAFWRREIDSKSPALFINPDKMPALMIRRRNSPLRILAGSRYKNFHYWAQDEFYHTPRVAERMAQIKTAEPVEMELPYGDHLEWRRHFMKQTQPWELAKSLAYLTARRAWWHYKGYEKVKGYYLSEEVGHAYSLYRDASTISALTKPLSSLKGEHFAFFPLHMEPEIALQQFSPECFAQLAVIAAIARDLPAGIKLAVKETAAALGRRPADFYGQIKEFKNVVLLDVYELGLEVVKQCDLVFTITGTGGFEGAALGKPVISFGRHNIYNCVPHVHPVTDIGSFREPIANALSPQFDREKAKFDGAQFLSAVLATSFDMDGFTSRRPDAITPKAAENLYAALQESLT